jgi:voltage-gated potassium channel
MDIEESNNSESNTLSSFNVIIFILSVYVLLALLVDTFFKLPLEISRLLNQIDFIICLVFLLDFCNNFYKAENKLKFIKWGWIDLIASIPTLDIFRAGRALRLFRILRILRAFKSVNHIIKHVYRRKTEGAFTTVAVIALLMLIFSSIAILQFENSPNSNIKTAEDAIWWAYVTITTVGYGDKYPVTTEGRIIAALLMTVGVGLFGTFTGYLASYFVSDNKEEINKKT